MEVFLASDEAFFPGLLVTACSAALFGPSGGGSLRVLDGGLTAVQRARLAEAVGSLRPRWRVDFIQEGMERLAGFARHTELGTMTYARLLVPLFAKESHPIYVDIDFLVTRNFEEVLGECRGGRPLWACAAYPYSSAEDCPWASRDELAGLDYFNCGFLVFDAGQWRAGDWPRKMLAFLDAHSSQCLNADQSAINWLLRGQIGPLDGMWNLVVPTHPRHPCLTPAPGTANLHYGSGMKPWKRPLPIWEHWTWWRFASLLGCDALRGFRLKDRLRKLHYALQRYSSQSLAAEKAQAGRWKRFFEETRLNP